MRLTQHNSPPEDTQDGIYLMVSEDRSHLRDLMTHPGLDFDALLGEGWDSKRVVLDLSQIDYVESAAIGWMICIHNAFEQHGGRVVLAGMQSPVARIFTVMRLDQVLQLAGDLNQARDLLHTERAES